MVTGGKTEKKVFSELHRATNGFSIIYCLFEDTDKRFSSRGLQLSVLMASLSRERSGSIPLEHVVKEEALSIQEVPPSLLPVKRYGHQSRRPEEAAEKTGFIPL